MIYCDSLALDWRLVGSAELEPTRLYKAFVLYPSEFEMIQVARSVFQGVINDGSFFKRGFVAPVIFLFFIFAPGSRLRDQPR